jgi:ABC-type antimicrobial peptide transport system permease subunit
VPLLSLGLVVAGVIAAGLLSSLGALRLATRMPVVDAIKSE